MIALFSQLGIDWRLFLSQAVNFFVLLAILSWFVYRPLVRLMNERRQKIETGLRQAAEAEQRLKAIDSLQAQKLAEADKAAVQVIASAEAQGQERSGVIIEQAEAKAGQLLTEAARIAEQQRQQEMERLTSQAATLVQLAIAKAVDMEPEQIDAALINKAVATLKDQTV